MKWDDDPSGTVHITNAAAEDIRGLPRPRFGGIPPVNLLPQDRRASDNS